METSCKHDDIFYKNILWSSSKQTSTPSFIKKRSPRAFFFLFVRMVIPSLFITSSVKSQPIKNQNQHHINFTPNSIKKTVFVNNTLIICFTSGFFVCSEKNAAINRKPRSIFPMYGKKIRSLKKKNASLLISSTYRFEAALFTQFEG